MSGPRFVLRAGLISMCMVMACGSAELAVDAGEDRELLLGATVQLAAELPDDVEGAVDFSWAFLTQPAGSQVSLTSEGAQASFTPTVPGDYSLSVTATSEKGEGEDAVSLTVLPNAPPIADAGADRTVAVGELVELDGRGSQDPDAQELGFLWSFLEVPDGSGATFSSSTSRTPSFTADRPGRYVLELAVNDGGFTIADQVVIVTNLGPVANAGQDQVVEVGQQVTLDGSGSYDADDDTLGFTWTLQSVPAGSAAVVVNASSPTAHFTPDLPGSYLVSLRVFDGVVADTATSNVQVLPVGGVVGSVVFVSPDGDDTNPGTETSPLATIAAALTKVEEVEQLYRIQLAAGTYSEAFGHEITDLTLEIVGPEEGVATLVASGILFEARGTSRLTLDSLRLETQGTALRLRGTNTYVGLDSVHCTAKMCVESGRFLGFSGGTVQVRDSRLVGAGGSPSNGLSSVVGQASVSTTEIVGFATGILLFDTPLLAREMTFRDNAQGISVLINTNAATILVEDSSFIGGNIGVQSTAAPNVRIRGCTFDGGGTGVEISGGALQLEDAVMKGMQRGVFISDTVNTGELVTVRGARFLSIAGPAFQVEGKKSHLDLGNASQPGDNQLASSAGIAIRDVRPVGASGQITLSDTTLNGGSLASGSYGGELTTGPFRISGDNNWIIVY